MSTTSAFPVSIAPWLSVQHAAAAVSFYMSAFGALEEYRLDTPDGLIVRLAVEGAAFWVSGGSVIDSPAPENVGGASVRMILTVANPDILFAQALKAGATEVYPVGEAHGWKLGRLVDPFGLHWEIGYQLPG